MPLPDVTLGGQRPAEPVPAETVTTDPAGDLEDALPVPAADSEEPAPGSDLAVRAEAAADRVAGAVRLWSTAAAESARKVTSRKGGIGDLHPESWNQYRARVESRSWLPDDHRGGFLEWGPLVHHYTLGPLGFWVGLGIKEALARPLVFYGLLFMAAVIYALWAFN